MPRVTYSKGDLGLWQQRWQWAPTAGQAINTADPTAQQEILLSASLWPRQLLVTVQWVLGTALQRVYY